jgi:choice-of-anchor C domain-containing protein
MKRISAGLALAMFLSVVSGTAHANLLLNGSFEIAPGQTDFAFYNRLIAGSTDIAGWIATGSDLDWVNAGYWDAADGKKSVDLAGQYLGGIKQTFATNIGQIYTVSFDLSGNPDNGTGDKIVAVSAGNVSGLQFTYSVTGANSHTNMAYSLETFSFTATSPSTTLSFVDFSPENWGPVIDNVDVEPSRSPVPEPMTMLLFGIGLIGVGGFSQMKKKA